MRSGRETGESSVCFKVLMRARNEMVLTEGSTSFGGSSQPHPDVGTTVSQGTGH